MKEPCARTSLGHDHGRKSVKTIGYASIDPWRPWNPPWGFFYPPSCGARHERGWAKNPILEKAPKPRLNFLLCCRCCQAPLHIFFFPLFFSLHTVFFRKYCLCSNVHQCSFEQLSSCRYCKRLQGQRRPRPSSWVEHPMRPVTWPRSRWRLPLALRPIVSNDLLSVRALTPVTRFSLRLSTPVGRPRGGDPIYTTACCAGPEFYRVASTSTKA